MGKNVLVIEDEPNIIEAISFILSRDGWSVATHSNGHDAVGVVQNAMPDLVILDVMLPGSDGYQILKSLRADPRTAELPVMILTAKGQQEDRRMAMEAGATEFVTKPFSNADVTDGVQRMLERR